jgi:hypothetical protein
MNLVDQKLLNKSSLDLYPGFQFWTKYRPQNVPSTYMRIDLYASIYGNMFTLGQHIFDHINQMRTITFHITVLCW